MFGTLSLVTVFAPIILLDSSPMHDYKAAVLLYIRVLLLNLGSDFEI